MRPFLAVAGALALLSTSPLQAGPRHPTPRRLGPVRPAGPSDPAAQDLLKRMLQAENSLALTGDQVTTVSRDGLDVSSEQQVMRAGARALRLVYMRPPRLAGEEILDNGRFYCHLIPAKDTLELSPSRIGNLRVRVPQVIGQIRSGRLIAQTVGQDVVAGHDCIVVQVATRSAAAVPWRRFWIDPTNGAQLRIEQYSASGQLQSASYYTEISYNPAFDRFTFRLPNAGSRVIERGFAAPSLTLDQVRSEAGAPVPAPSYVPEGFHFQAGSVSDAHGRKVLELRYVNGVNVLSVFETSDTPGSGPSRMEHPRQGVLFGRQAGMKVVVIGNLNDAEIERVLTSLR